LARLSGRQALQGKHDLGFAGGMNRAAFFVDASQGWDGVEGVRGGEVPGGPVFALLSRGLDEFSVGAGFDGGSLQGGWREAVVAKSAKKSRIISPGPR
jgi:hypothetical protein